MLTLMATGYAYRDAYLRLGHTRSAVLPHLSAALAGSSLATLDVCIAYGPMVMPDRPAGAKAPRASQKMKMIEVEPALDYAVFVSGLLPERLRAYIGGIAGAAPHLATFGATAEQTAEFLRILAEAPAAILAGWPAGEPMEPVVTEAQARQERAQDERHALITAAFGTGPGNGDPKAFEALLAGLPPADRARFATMKARYDQQAAPDIYRHDAPAAPEAGGDGRGDAGEPAKIAIDPDDHHAEFVGRTADGRQFFLTTPFEPGGSEFVALYLFDAMGTLIEAWIEEFGPRATMDMARRRKVHDDWLASLGEISIERIEIAPFSVERFGTTFGLIPREPDFEAAEMMPGNFMCFFPPWDSGEYDT